MMLKDLNTLAEDAKTRRSTYNNGEIILSDYFKAEFHKRLPSSKFQFFKHTAIDYTGQGLTIVIPNQWFVIASFFTDYLRSLFQYKEIVQSFGFSSDLIKSFKANGSLDTESYNLIKGKLSEADALFIIRFLSDYQWWYGSKTIDRGDFFISSILNLSSVVHVTQGHIATLTELLLNNEDLIPHLKSSILDASNETLIEETNFNSNVISEFATWLISQPTNNYFDRDLNRALKGLGSYQEKYMEVFGKDVFDIDFSNIEETLQEIKDYIYDSSTDFFEYSKKTSNHQPKAILGDKNYLKFLEEYKLETQISVKEGYNKIYFGSPGTGKSYAISKQIEKVDEYQIERVIFHPDYDYSSFIGGYKPITEKDSDDKDIIKYKFVPQIFINIFEKAHRNPNKNFYLVIEEINRGNCAEIFGDIFQLLDRNPDYAITPSEDLNKYFLERDKLSKLKVLKNGKLVMPSNLIILATMNTSDQSLYPMDSAFKRRWDWEYVPITHPSDKGVKSCPSFEYLIKVDDTTIVRWVDFIKAVNLHILKNPSLGLDKCIGNFFVKPDKDGFISLSTLVNKVIFYLWNDVFKDEENQIFNDHTYSNYFPIESDGLKRISSLIDMFQKQGIFQIEKFINDLTETPKSIDETAH